MTVWRVTVDPKNTQRGRLKGPNFDAPCVLGKNGAIDVAKKTERDAKTPLGSFPVRHILYRADKITAPKSSLPLIPIEKSMGWCDDITHQAYNKPIEFPFEASAETLWREDNLYDLILIIGHNDNPVVRDRGSAIFVHIARDDFSYTMGCVAMNYNDLVSFIEALEPDDTFEIAHKPA